MNVYSCNFGLVKYARSLEQNTHHVERQVKLRYIFGNELSYILIHYSAITVN